MLVGVVKDSSEQEVVTHKILVSQEVRIGTEQKQKVVKNSKSLVVVVDLTTENLESPTTKDELKQKEKLRESDNEKSKLVDHEQVQKKD